MLPLEVQLLEFLLRQNANSLSTGASIERLERRIRLGEQVMQAQAGSKRFQIPNHLTDRHAGVALFDAVGGIARQTGSRGCLALMNPSRYTETGEQLPQWCFVSASTAGLAAIS
ncbi:hypothetical protein VI03_29195 [Burkholderia vietnamiensis]|uniref:Uncharacterized protein n=1 Tax=Burkholderia ubonensis TaxID=101571 RepID=A0A1B4LI84_9BURK|nr:hypothetical protein WJ35_17775 [Burkholderia ubonensis]AOK02485.1 hypothetical protein WK23_27775 [Burkholderia vietnamiensis]AOK13996.1 hypothetical protein WK31_27235 [Burkholderia vietnamiensis]AOK44928.1 hypothetical protein WL96_27910 [Burkholderia vietnamiensis]KKI35357.1 hypothetical protein VI03_29195 [Burkholderia vietnamiensis]